MAEFTANALQAVGPNGVVVLYNTSCQCCCNNCCCNDIEHTDGTGSIVLRGCKPKGCKVKYKVSFGANVAIPAGGTLGPLSIALAINGEPIPATTATVTPGALGDFNNIFTERIVKVPANCCLTVAVRNINTQAIQLQNANLLIDRL